MLEKTSQNGTAVIQLDKNVNLIKIRFGPKDNKTRLICYRYFNILNSLIQPKIISRYPTMDRSHSEFPLNLSSVKLFSFAFLLA